MTSSLPIPLQHFARTQTMSLRAIILCHIAVAPRDNRDNLGDKDKNVVRLLSRI